MASAAVDTGTGITVVFATSAFTAQLTEVTPFSAEREAIGTTHLGTTATPSGDFGAMTSIPADLTKAGQLSIKGHFNPDTLPPIEEAAETVTITFGSGATLIFTGFMVSYTPGGFTFNQKMEFDAVVEISGAASPTAAV